MFGYVANGVGSANTDTGVDTLETHTGHPFIALIVRFTLPTTSSRQVKRISIIPGQAKACAGSVGFATLGVGTTWGRTARM